MEEKRTDENQEQKVFGVRERWRKIRAWDGVFHLLSLSVGVLIVLAIYPGMPGDGNKAAVDFVDGFSQVSRSQNIRQLLVEALDKIIRYENYYKDIHGHYTRDLSRLGLPDRLSTGSFDDVRRVYEVAVVELTSNRVVVMANGADSAQEKMLTRFDRMTMDERHRISANFVMPPPSRAYLYEEADRMLGLQLSGKSRLDSVVANFWNIESHGEGITDITAVGQKNPVLGVKRSLNTMGKAITLFDSVHGVLSGKNMGHATRNLAMISSEEKEKNNSNQVRRAADVRALLRDVYQAQYIHKRERGTYAKRWEDLDAIAGFHFQEEKNLSSNLRFQPIEVNEQGYQITIEGTSGDLMGEQFQMSQNGSIRQVRYTDALIQQLQHSTAILENTFKFQISEVPGAAALDGSSMDAKAFLDSTKAGPVKLIDQGKAKKE